MNKFWIHGTLNDGTLDPRLLLFIKFWGENSYINFPNVLHTFFWFYISPGSWVF